MTTCCGKLKLELPCWLGHHLLLVCLSVTYPRSVLSATCSYLCQCWKTSVQPFDGWKLKHWHWRKIADGLQLNWGQSASIKQFHFVDNLCKLTWLHERGANTIKMNTALQIWGWLLLELVPISYKLLSAGTKWGCPLLHSVCPLQEVRDGHFSGMLSSPSCPLLKLSDMSKQWTILLAKREGSLIQRIGL